MQANIHPYITFSGNCKSAMRFYQKCLGGELTFQAVGDYPISVCLPSFIKKRIVAGVLKSDRLLLTGTDMVNEEGLVKGNAISLLLNCNTEQEIKDVYRKLSLGGKKTHPLKENNHNILTGCLIDKFGHHWLLQYKRLP